MTHSAKSRHLIGSLPTAPFLGSNKFTLKWIRHLFKSIPSGEGISFSNCTTPHHFSKLWILLFGFFSGAEREMYMVQLLFPELEHQMPTEIPTGYCMTTETRCAVHIWGKGGKGLTPPRALGVCSAKARLLYHCDKGNPVRQTHQTNSRSWLPTLSRQI